MSKFVKSVAIKYTIFKTKWGWFGLAGIEKGLLRTCLPLADSEKVKSHLLSSIRKASCGENRASPQDAYRRSIEFDKPLFKTLQEQITAYFEGACVNFSRDIPLVLGYGKSFCHCELREAMRGNLTEFTKQVLTACRDIKFGQTISYGQLAQKIDRPTVASPIRNSMKGRKPQKGKISNAARAVGNALAKNPMPLIIPCHRVVCSPCLRRGKLVPAKAGIGGFSAPGGVNLKKKMLELEHRVAGT